MKRLLPVLLLLSAAASAQSQSPIPAAVETSIQGVEPRLISWRRDIHQHPELGNREFRTAELVATHLRSLGLEVTTGVAHTGVVAVLKGGRPGPSIALRADMDALPVTEQNDLPFRSLATSEYNGQTVGVMHACGHDTHVAILMATAEVLAKHKNLIRGTVTFIFQPAEEGPPVGEEGGAELMVEQGVMTGIDRVYGLHINSQTPANTITWRPGGIMASADDFKLVVKGKQAHGAAPWDSVDPIVVSSQIISNLQTIISRQLNVTENAGIVTIGSIHGGVRSNIIPSQVEMLGTIRALSPSDRDLIHTSFRKIVTGVAESHGATVDLKLPYTTAYPVTFNDPALAEKTAALLKRVAGDANVNIRVPMTGAEDFSFFAQKAPGFFFFLGGMSPETPLAQAPSHHTPEFVIDESGLLLGVKAFVAIALSQQ
jgi:amidohydrolase